MIIDNLFPTTGTFTQGLQNQYTGELAENFGGGTPVVNSLENYWLGYISRDNLPLQYTMGAVYVDTDGGVFVCKDTTDTANFPCTYVRHGYQSGQNQYYRIILSKSVNGGTPEITYASVRPFNQLYPEYAGMDFNSITGYKYALSITGQAMVFDGGNNLLTVDSYYNPNGQFGIYFGYDGSAVSPAYGNRMIKSAYDFLFKNAEIEIKIYVNSLGDYITFKCRASDFNDGGTAFLDNGTYTARLFITQFSMHSFIRIYQNGNTDLLPLGFAVKTSNHYGENQYEYEISSIGTFMYPIIYSDIRNVTAANPNLYFGCGFDDTFPISEITRIQNYNSSSTGYPYGYTDNLLFSKSSPSVAIYPLVTIDQIRKTFSLSFRVDISGSHMPGYAEGFTYATDVSAQDEFLARLKTGDIENPEFKNSLRPWQYDNFQLDDFEPDDVPPYVPPGPGPGPRPEPVDPGDDETGGDDYEPNNPAGLGSGFGFVTQYAIRAAHLTDLGSKLWEGFFSEDEPGGIFQYMNNFIFAVNTDTGSVNFSDIMNFFISLRAYPCPVSAMASTSAGGQDMYVGSGSKPIHLNTTFSIVNDLIGNINAGELSVPYWFGDYRDYSLECIVYLPYCGTIQLNPGDIMGGTLSVNYTVDFCSGACVAYVLCTTWDGKLLRVGSLQGQLGADVPMTATNAGQVAARMYGDRIDAAETFTGALKSVISGGTSVAGGNYGGAVSAGFGAFIDPALQQERLRANMGSRGAIAAPMLSAGRGLSGFADSKTVFLQIRSPIYAEPDNYDNVVGMPSTSAVRIGDCSGFCQFINVDVSGITTDLDDQQTIRRALESGIII